MFATSETPTGPTQEPLAPSDDLRSADLGVRIGMQRSADSIDKNGYPREREITVQTQSATPTSLQACAARAFGIAIGNLFLGGFGMVWIVLGLTAAGKINPLLLALLSVVLVALIIASGYIMRRTHGSLDRSQANRIEQKKINRRFGLVNFLQWSLIFAAVFGLPRLGLARWIVPAIVLIVGIHFFPLARLFKARMHYVVGAIVVAWAIIYPILFSAGKGDSLGAIGMGVILLVGAAFACWRAFHLLHSY
jgi:hypothetical protein